MSPFYHSQEPSWACAPLHSRVKFKETNLRQGDKVLSSSCLFYSSLFGDTAGPSGFPQHSLLQF